MGEQIDHLADLDLLKFGRIVDRAVRRGDPLLVVEGAEFFEKRNRCAFGGPKFERTEVGRQEHIKSGLLELGDLIVHPIQRRGVEFHAAILRLDAGPAGPVGELVQPHGIDAVSRVETAAAVGQLFFGSGGAVAEVQAPQLDGLAVIQELIGLAFDAAELAGGRVDPVLHADLGGLAIVGVGAEFVPGLEARLKADPSAAGVELHGGRKIQRQR